MPGRERRQHIHNERHDERQRLNGQVNVPARRPEEALRDLRRREPTHSVSTGATKRPRIRTCLALEERLSWESSTPSGGPPPPEV